MAVIVIVIVIDWFFFGRVIVIIIVIECPVIEVIYITLLLQENMVLIATNLVLLNLSFKCLLTILSYCVAAATAFNC